MGKHVLIQVELPPGASEAGLRRFVEEWVAGHRRDLKPGGALLVASPVHAHAEEQRRYAALCARLFKQSGLAAELRHRLVTTDLITELHAPETDFGLMLVYEPTVGFLARQGLLRQLDTLLPDAQKRFHELALRRGTEAGHLYGAPLFLSCRALFYRRDLLEKHGFKPPRTFEEMESSARHIVRMEADPRLRGLSIEGQSLNRFNLLLDLIWSQGEEMFRGEGPWSFNTAAWRRALERLQGWRNLCARQAYSWNATQSTEAFLAGEAVYALGWTDLMRLIHENGPEARRRFGWIAHPTDRPGVARKVRVGGPSLVIPRATRHPHAAEKIVTGLLDLDTQERLLRHAGWPFPSQVPLWSRPAVREANPYVAEAENFLKDGALLEERGFLRGNYLNWQNAVNAECESIDPDERRLRRLEEQLTALLPSRPYKGLVAQAVEIIERRAAAPLQVGTLAAELVVSREHFIREFRKQTGTTPLQFIHQRQMEKAREMLLLTHYHVGEVAEKLGYKDLGYFSRLFKKIIKKKPSEFKRAGF